MALSFESRPTADQNTPSIPLRFPAQRMLTKQHWLHSNTTCTEQTVLKLYLFINNIFALHYIYAAINCHVLNIGQNTNATAINVECMWKYNRIEICASDSARKNML